MDWLVVMVNLNNVSVEEKGRLHRLHQQDSQPMVRVLQVVRENFPGRYLSEKIVKQKVHFRHQWLTCYYYPTS